MNSLRRLLIAVPAATALAAAVAVPSAGAAPVPNPVPQIGISNQDFSFFTQPLFTQLGAGSARIVVPWDVRLLTGKLGRDLRPYISTWITTARQNNVQPLVVFANSTQHRKAPTSAKYNSEIKRFIAEHPGVESYSAWNEPNLCGQGLCRTPKLAAAYAKDLAAACRGKCNALAGDLVVAPPIKGKELDAGLYARQMRKLGHLKAKIWGIHNYTDANRFQTTWTKKALKDMPGQIWFDETAGMVHRPRHSTAIPKAYQYPASVSRSAKVLTYLLTKLVRVSSRVKRVYIYQWYADNPKNWDSGILDHSFNKRPAYAVLQKAINRARTRHGRLG